MRPSLAVPPKKAAGELGRNAGLNFIHAPLVVVPVPATTKLPLPVRIVLVGDGARFAFIAEEEVRLFERSVQGIAEHLDDKGIGASDGDLRAVLFGDADGFL